MIDFADHLELALTNPSRLHNEICDFYDYVRPQDYEHTIRTQLLERLQKVVSQRIPDASVLCFGSFAAGLYLPNADMDVVVASSTYLSGGPKVICSNSKNELWRFAQYLATSHIAENNIEVIAQAKVPLVKFVDRVTGIKVDVSFENNTGLAANRTFNEWSRQFPAMPVLVTVIKQFLMMRGMNEVVFGGLGGFSVTCLVTSLLQHMPSVQSGACIPEDRLGEMLLEFLDFYGNQMDLERTGIAMHPPGRFKKVGIESCHPYPAPLTHFQDYFQGHGGPKRTYKANKAYRLTIMDPNKPDNDISGGSRLVAFIFGRFSRARDEILAAMQNPKRTSLLDWCLAGNYDIFTAQRNRLLKIYSGRPNQ